MWHKTPNELTKKINSASALYNMNKGLSLMHARFPLLFMCGMCDLICAWHDCDDAPFKDILHYMFASEHANHVFGSAFCSAQKHIPGRHSNWIWEEKRFCGLFFYFYFFRTAQIPSLINEHIAYSKQRPLQQKVWVTSLHDNCRPRCRLNLKPIANRRFFIANILQIRAPQALSKSAQSSCCFCAWLNYSVLTVVFQPRYDSNDLTSVFKLAENKVSISYTVLGYENLHR